MWNSKDIHFLKLIICASNTLVSFQLADDATC